MLIEVRYYWLRGTEDALNCRAAGGLRGRRRKVQPEVGNERWYREKASGWEYKCVP